MIWLRVRRRWTRLALAHKHRIGAASAAVTRWGARCSMRRESARVLDRKAVLGQTKAIGQAIPPPYLSDPRGFASFRRLPLCAYQHERTDVTGPHFLDWIAVQGKARPDDGGPSSTANNIEDGTYDKQVVQALVAVVVIHVVVVVVALAVAKPLNCSLVIIGDHAEVRHRRLIASSHHDKVRQFSLIESIEGANLSRTADRVSPKTAERGAVASESRVIAGPDVTAGLTARPNKEERPLFQTRGFFAGCVSVLAEPRVRLRPIIPTRDTGRAES